MNEQAVATRQPPPTSLRAAYWIIAAHGLSSFCLGMVFPFVAIYLLGIPGVGAGGVALYYATVGGANLATALLLAAGVVRPPRVPLGVAGCLLAATGFGLLTMVTGLPTAVAAGLGVGTGMGCFLAAVIPIINSLVAKADRRRIFARRYQVLNATLASGSLLAGVLIAILTRDAIRYLILVNALGWLPVAATLWRHRRAARAGEHARTEVPTADGGSASEGGGSSSASGGAGAGTTRLPVHLLFKVCLGAALFQLGVFLFGFSQFEVTMPLVTHELLGASLVWVSVVIAVNVLVIAVAQPWVTRLLQPYSEVVGLRVAIGLWIAGYLLASLTALAPGLVPLFGLVGYAVLFALGECAYS